MNFKFGRNPDPHFESMADNEISVCEEMVEYSDMYFSRNTFVKKMYVGQNGVILVIPLKEDDLCTNEAEQKRCRACLEEIYECLGLHLYIYPVLAGQEKCFVLGSADNFDNIAEIDEPYEFADQLSKYTYENLTRPSDIPKLVDAIYQFEPTEPYVTKEGELIEASLKVALDINTVERIMTVVTYMEGNERPQDAIKYDEYGNMLVLRDSDLRIGPVDTGLIGKKKWFRISDEEPKKYAIAATLFGWAGIHRFLHGDMKNFALYLATFGFAGILPAADLLAMFTGNYSFKDITYEETNLGLKRNVERIYLQKAGSIVVGLVCILVSLGLGFVLTKYGYTKILSGLMNLVGQVLTSATQTKM